MRSTNATHLERYLGAANVQRLSHAMCNDAAKWYGPPIALKGVPGNVWATKDGDFIGPCDAGFFTSAMDRGRDLAHRLQRAARVATDPRRRSTLHAGFSSLSALISEVTVNATRQELALAKSGPTGVINASSTLWRVGSLPQAGGAGSATPAGRATTSATTGAWNAFQNAASGKTNHFLSANILASLQNTLLIYDRLFDVAKTVSSSATESVTGTPTRYQSTTATDQNYIGGNFGFIEAFAAVSGVAHNWTVCQYTKEDGTTTSTLPSVTGVNGAIIDRLDQPLNTWFVPLAAGDVGIMKWTQLQCSVNTVATAINFCIGHPIAWIPCLIANQISTYDGINTAFNLVRIFDNACLAMLEVSKPAATATTYTGTITLAGGNS